MKRNLFFVTILCGGLSFAQTTGKVGVQTDNPTETLDVKGTVRVQTLPKDGEKVSTPSVNTNFDATKTVVVDENGVLGTVEGVPYTKRKNEDPDVKEIVSKCISEEIGKEGYRGGKVLSFIDGLMFRYIEIGAGSGNLDVKYTGIDAPAEYKGKGNNIASSFGAAQPGDFTIKKDEWKTFSNISFQNSDWVYQQFILHPGGKMVEMKLRTINKDNTKYYSLCVSQVN